MPGTPFSLRAPRLTGVDLARDAVEVGAQRVKENWPYAHVYPPPDADTVHLINTEANPGAGTPVVVLSYLVPTGYRLVLQAVLQVYSGTVLDGPILPGDASWTVFSNRSGGSVARPEQGLTAVTVPLGSLANGNQWPFARAYEYGQDSIVESVATSVNLAGGFFTSGFFGYLIPDIESEGQ